MCSGFAAPAVASPLHDETAPVYAVVLTLTGAAVGGPYEDGIEALQHGDFEAALKIWLPLAEQGHAYAQNNLGMMFAKGDGVQKNMVLAYMLFNLAAQQGNTEAAKARAIAAVLMTPEQITMAERLTREWLAAH
jgi:TPR repeat protein